MPERDRAAVDVELLHGDRQILQDREDLRRERFVQFHQIEILERQAGLRQQLPDGRHGADTHDARIDAGTRPPDDARQRRDASRLRRRAAHDHHGGPAVGNTGCRPGGDDAGRAVDAVEGEREFSQALDRRARARMLVGGEGLGLALRIGEHYGRDLVLEPAGGDRALGALLRLERVGVGHFARDRVLPREHFDRLAHDHAAHRAGEAVAVHGVDEREVAHLVPPSRVFRIDEVRHPAHRFDPAGEDHIRFAEEDRLGARGDRLHPGGARLVDRLRGHGVGDAGADPHLARGIRTRPGLPGMPDQHLVDRIGRDACASHGGGRGGRAEIRGMHVAKRSAVAADRRARRADNHDVRARHNPPILSHATQPTLRRVRHMPRPAARNGAFRILTVIREEGLMRFRPVAMLIAISFMGSPAIAQKQRGSIEGVVKDTSGAVAVG